MDRLGIVRAPGVDVEVVVGITTAERPVRDDPTRRSGREEFRTVFAHDGRMIGRHIAAAGEVRKRIDKGPDETRPGNQVLKGNLGCPCRGGKIDAASAAATSFPAKTCTNSALSAEEPSRFGPILPCDKNESAFPSTAPSAVFTKPSPVPLSVRPKSPFDPWPVANRAISSLLPSIRCGRNSLQVAGHVAETRHHLAESVLDASKNQNLKIDSEGGVQQKQSQNRVIVPMALNFLAGRAFDTDENQILNRTVASNGFGFVGRLVGILADSRNVAAGIGFYAVAFSVYDLWLAHGHDVSFVRNTRIEVTTVPRTWITRRLRD